MDDQLLNVLRHEGRELNANISVKNIEEKKQKLSPKSSLNQKQKNPITPQPSFSSINRPSPSPTTSHSDNPRKVERPQSASNIKRKSSCEYKQMEVKHQTMLTNLASSYYEKFNLKPVSFEHSNNKIMYQRNHRNEKDLLVSTNVVNLAIQKLTIKESAIDNRGNKKENVCQNKNKNSICRIVKKEISQACIPITYSSTESDIGTGDLDSQRNSPDAKPLLNDLDTSEEFESRSDPYFDAKDAFSKTNRVEDKIVKKTTKYFGVQTSRKAPMQTVDKSTSSTSVCGDSFGTSTCWQNEGLSPNVIDNCTATSNTNLSQNESKNSKHSSQKSSIPVKCPNSSYGTIPKHITRKTGNNLLHKIKFIIEEVKGLQEEMNNFSGVSVDDRDYVYMDEVMMRNLIKLDNLEISNSDERAKRKEAIQFVQNSMNRLQEKLNENLEEHVSDYSFFDNDVSLPDLRSKRKIRSSIKMSEKE